MDSVCLGHLSLVTVRIEYILKKTLSQLAMGFNIFSYTNWFLGDFWAVFLLAYEVFLFYTPATVANIDN